MREQYWLLGRKENRAQKWVRELTEGADDDSKDFSAVLPDVERETILFAEIRRLTRKGYRLEKQTQHTASMTNPAAEPMGVGMLLAGILTLGLAWVFAPIRRGRQNDKTVYLEVASNGTVVTTTTGGMTKQDVSNVPEIEVKR